MHVVKVSTIHVKNLGLVTKQVRNKLLAIIIVISRIVLARLIVKLSISVRLIVAEQHGSARTYALLKGTMAMDTVWHSLSLKRDDYIFYKRGVGCTKQSKDVNRFN